MPYNYIYLILLELGILFLAALIELTKNLWGPLKSYIGVVPIHLWLATHTFYPVTIALGVARTLLLILAFVVVTFIIEPLIYLILPYHKWSEWWRSPVRDAIKWCFIVLLWVVAASLSCIWISVFIKISEFFTSVIVDVIMSIVFSFIEEPQFDAIFDFYSGLP